MEQEKTIEQQLFEINSKRDRSRKRIGSDSAGSVELYWMIRGDSSFKVPKGINKDKFIKIVSLMNQLYAEDLVTGKSVAFPYNMGGIEVVQREGKAWMHDGKVHVNYPINWKGTWELWLTDEEAKQNKTLVRWDKKTLYTVRYSKLGCSYLNHEFYRFRVVHRLASKIEKLAIAGDIQVIFKTHMNY